MRNNMIIVIRLIINMTSKIHRTLHHTLTWSIIKNMPIIQRIHFMVV